MSTEAQPDQNPEAFAPTSFNLSATMETVMGSEELFQQIAEMLIENCPGHLSKIKAAIVANNSDALEKEAHSLKGAVGNFGADDAYEAAFDLEMLGRSGEMAGSEEGFSTLESALDKLLSEMKIVLGRMS